MTRTEPDYWLQRFAHAIDSAAGAPGELSRTAYMDLARHYWSMHTMVHGRPATTLPPLTGGKADALLMEWAA
jgi:hypothetical protein